MGVNVTELPDASGGISAEEWSILEPLLPDRWPDGRPRPWYPPVLDVLRTAARISLLAYAVGYGLDRIVSIASTMSGIEVIGQVIAAVLAFGVFGGLILTLGGLLVLSIKRDAINPEPAVENLPTPFAALNEQFARLLADGQGEEADHQADEVCRLTHEGLGADHPALAELLYSRAMLLMAMDQPATAVALLEEAERIWRGALTPDSLDLADVDFALAMLYRALGDAPRAEQHYRACAEIAGGSGRTGSRLAVSSLQAVGEIREERGDGVEAEALYQRVVDFLGEYPGAGSKRSLIAMDKLIAVQLARQDYPAARSLLLQVLHVTHRDYPEGHPFQADRLDDLGRLYHSMGAYERADPLYERAQDIRQRAFGADTPVYTLSLCNRAELAAAIGDPVSALDLLSRMSAVESQLIGRAAQGRSERQMMPCYCMFY
jgi:tetratricopeptide (TPR) repeat protein